jgi:hypothetical protein
MQSIDIIDWLVACWAVDIPSMRDASVSIEMALTCDIGAPSFLASAFVRMGSRKLFPDEQNDLS